MIATVKKAEWTKDTALTFMPSRIQFYEAGIDWRLSNKSPVKITGSGWKAPSEEEEKRLLEAISKNKQLHIVVYGNHEIPKEAQASTKEAIALKAENATLKEGMEALRAELEAERAKNKK